MIKYSDLDSGKKAFILELDNVLYPERDYLLQVYYLFANFIEFTETAPSSKDLIDFLKNSYELRGSNALFSEASKLFCIDNKYEENFRKLHYTARLPLKLFLYAPMLILLQEMVVDRKQIFIVTNGSPAVQLNKIKQTEWNGLEKYLTVYFAEETKLKPATETLELIFNQHQLLRKDLLIIGVSNADEEFASAGGIDFINGNHFIS